MTTLKRSNEEIVEDYYNLVSEHGADYSTLDKDVVTRWLRTILTEKDAEVEKALTTLHTSLVAAVEGKKKQIWSEVDEVDYNQALDDTITIINSLFKE